MEIQIYNIDASVFYFFFFLNKNQKQLKCIFSKYLHECIFSVLNP